MQKTLSDRTRRPASVAVALAVALAWAFGVLLGVRTLASPDIGYHLAYGEQFLNTGKVVDHNPYIYTLPTATGEAQRPLPGPGCWYDDDGRYRFANANWLAQIVLAGVHRLAGPIGLTVLQAALVAGIFAFGIASMRRVAVGWPVVAAGCLLIALTSYERLTLRPELFSYFILAVQLWILLTSRITWPKVGALIGLQWLLANVHSYSLLALALTGCFLVDALVRLGWQRYKALSPGDRRPIRRRARLLLVLLVGQIGVGFINPWTWRLVVLPVQTLLFLRKHHIGAGDYQSTGHPWSMIGEFFGPFTARTAALHVGVHAYCVLLALAIIGAVCCLLKRRWAWLLIIAAFAVVSLSMRRNIAIASMMITPLACGACWSLLKAPMTRLSLRTRRRWKLAISCVLIAAALLLCVAVVTQEFYFQQRMTMRFGAGLQPAEMPIGAAGWVNDHAPSGRVWCDYDSSSNVYYWLRPRRDVPLLTNTWAYPPDIMADALAASKSIEAFRHATGPFDVQVVILHVGGATYKLAQGLLENEQWSLVYLEGSYTVFVRNDGANAALARAHALSPETFDVEAYKRALIAADPMPAHALHIGGLTLSHFRWDRPAVEVFAEAVERKPRYYEAWNNMGVCLARLGEKQLRSSGRTDKLLRAERCFRRALELKSDYAPARGNLALVRRSLDGSTRPRP